MHKTPITGRDPRTGNGIALSVREGRIVEIQPSSSEEKLWISSGLVDLQVNGYRGFDLNSDNTNATTVSALTRELLATGVTTFAPTLITASREQLLARLCCIAEAHAKDALVAACVPFIHVEGPYISPLDGYRGAHPVEHVRPPSLDEFEEWQQASGNLIGMVTLSPHFDGAIPYIASLVRRGVHVAIGHTQATAAQIHAAAEAGASLSTHLGNGVPFLLDRHPNPIWSQLAEDRLQATFISDGHHLSADVLQVMLRAKTVDRSILISDAVALAGMPPGRYIAPIGGEVELSIDGRLEMVGETILAGAAVSLLACVSRAVRMTKLPLAAVLQMATTNPGRLVGNRGELHNGARADIIQFAWNEAAAAAEIKAVWLAGDCINLG